MVERKENYNQVAVCQGLDVSENEIEEFVEFIKNEFETRVQFLETVITKPDIDHNGNLVPETGGRKDVLIAVHDDDIIKFSVSRFKAGIRWLEDCVSITNNPNGIIYDKSILDYVTWNTEDIEM